jgi:hypothetical protein
VAVALVVPGCVALTWWQVARALSGNTLSWVYSFEWPIFAAYALYMWWKLLHEEPASEGDHPKPVGVAAGVAATPGAPLPGDGAARGDQARVRPAPGADDGAGAEAKAGEEGADEEELAAYNRYLAELNASGKRKRW